MTSRTLNGRLFTSRRPSAVTSFTGQRLKCRFRFRSRFYQWFFWLFRIQCPLWMNTLPQNPPLTIRPSTLCNELIVVVFGWFFGFLRWFWPQCGWWIRRTIFIVCPTEEGLYFIILHSSLPIFRILSNKKRSVFLH